MPGPSRPRPPRADAARNRAALLAAARDALTSAGPDVSLEAVARSAGVGIGTLYRNFPTRDDLVAAVYGQELDAVLATVDPLLEGRRPDAALRAFMREYAGFIETKRGMAEVVRSEGIRAAAATSDTRARVNAAISRFLDEGIRVGVLRPVPADDVTAAMIGVFLSTADAPDTDQAERLLDLIVDGLRAGSTSGSGA